MMQWASKTRLVKWSMKRMGITSSTAQFSGVALADIAVDGSFGTGSYVQAKEGTLQEAKSSKMSYDDQLAASLWEELPAACTAAASRTSCLSDTPRRRRADPESGRVDRSINLYLTGSFRTQMSDEPRFGDPTMSMATVTRGLSAVQRGRISSDHAQQCGIFSDRAIRTQRARRCIGATASVIIVSAACSLMGAGTASAMPRDCKTYASAMEYQLQWEDYWLGQWTNAVSNSSWGELHTDIRQYGSAVAGYNRVVAEATAAGC